MKRRFAHSASSLDLFLDTICNAFGGIMFIAILLSIISQFRSKSNEAIDVPDPVVAQRSIAEFEQVVSEMQEMRMSLDGLRQQAASLNVESSQAEREVLQEAMSKLTARNAEYDAVMKVIEETLRHNVQMELELKKLDEELAQKQQELAQKRGELEALRSKKSVSMQLPVVRSSTKSNLLLVMRYQKTYLVKRPDQGNFYTEHVNVRNFLGTDYVTPIPTAGWSLDDAANLADFASQLKGFSSKRYIVTIGVWSDSYDAFSTTKAQLIQMGFDYELIPLGEIPEIPLGSGSNVPRVQ